MALFYRSAFPANAVAKPMSWQFAEFLQDLPPRNDIDIRPVKMVLGFPTKHLYAHVTRLGSKIVGKGKHVGLALTFPPGAPDREEHERAERSALPRSVLRMHDTPA